MENHRKTLSPSPIIGKMFCGSGRILELSPDPAHCVQQAAWQNCHSFNASLFHPGNFAKPPGVSSNPIERPQHLIEQ